MKKYFAILLTLTLMLTVVGCASSAVAPDPAVNSDATQEATEVVTEAVTEEITVQATQATEKSTQTDEKISEKRAKKIALEHAGFKESDVTRLHVELDYDDGVLRYEIDFHVGNVEYDYDIEAYSGDILSYDKDIDD